jgi:hypothetical protein
MYYSYRLTFGSIASRLAAENYLNQEIACWSLESALRQITITVIIMLTELEKREIRKNTNAVSLEQIQR